MNRDNTSLYLHISESGRIIANLTFEIVIFERDTKKCASSQRSDQNDLLEKILRM